MLIKNIPHTYFPHHFRSVAISFSHFRQMIIPPNSFHISSAYAVITQSPFPSQVGFKRVIHFRESTRTEHAIFSQLKFQLQIYSISEHNITFLVIWTPPLRCCKRTFHLESFHDGFKLFYFSEQIHLLFSPLLFMWYRPILRGRNLPLIRRVLVGFCSPVRFVWISSHWSNRWNSANQNASFTFVNRLNYGNIRVCRCVIASVISSVIYLVNIFFSFVLFNVKTKQKKINTIVIGLLQWPFAIQCFFLHSWSRHFYRTRSYIKTYCF